MALSLITSLYRSDSHLPQYIKRVQVFASQISYPLEMVIVVNDATDTERRLLETLRTRENFSVTVIYTDRETLYASWNRGIAAARYDILGSWNVDDIRAVEGIEVGVKLLQTDVNLVDFAFDMIQGDNVRLYLSQYNPHSLSPRTAVSPFFMFQRDLYEKAGAFNPNFRITGDFEWAKREAVRSAKAEVLSIVGGQFFLHEDNLSGGHSPLEWVEFNTALLWHGGFDLLRPVDPKLMRDTWEAWGHTGGTMPDPIADWLWGRGAEARYLAYQRERNAHPLLRRIRLSLARRGLWNSVEWEVHHSKRGFSK